MRNNMPQPNYNPPPTPPPIPGVTPIPGGINIQDLINGFEKEFKDDAKEYLQFKDTSHPWTERQPNLNQRIDIINAKMNVLKRDTSFKKTLNIK